MQDDTSPELEIQQPTVPINAFYMQQGDLRKVAFIQGESVGKRIGGGDRGVIKGFSKPSRRRLLHLFARLNPKGVRCVFLTLTFTDQDSAVEAKRAFRRFRERLRRRFPLSSFIWRMERQLRGTVHFHVVLFNFPYVPQKTIQTWWQECTKEDTSIIHVKLLRGKRRVFYYISKYCGKPSDGSVTSLDNSTYMHAKGKPSLHPAIEQARDRDNAGEQTETDGRVWGIFQRWLLPYAKYTAWRLDDFDHALYLRWRGLQVAKVTYCPSRYSNIEFIEFGGAGRLLAGLESIPPLEHHVAQRLSFKYNWY